MNKRHLYIVGATVFTATTTAASVLIWREAQAGRMTREVWLFIGTVALYSVLITNLLYLAPRLVRRVRDSERSHE